MRPCFAFTLNDPYVIMFKPLLRSMLDVNPGFDYNIYIFCNYSLSAENRESLLKIYPKITFHEVNAYHYTSRGKMTIKYFSIEAFSLYRYGEKKVILAGADCLCIAPLDKLVALDVDFGLPRERNRPEMYSNGVMCIGEKYLNEKTYWELMRADYRHVEMFGNDMRHYNCFFKGRITEIDYMYSVTNTEIQYFENDEKEFGLRRRFEDIVFLHFIVKPIERESRRKLGKKVYNLWMRYYRIDYPEEATK